MRPRAGVAGAVILPVAGLGVGVAQVIRGAANTPEAIKESRQGRYWDQVRNSRVKIVPRNQSSLKYVCNRRRSFYDKSRDLQKQAVVAFFASPSVCV